MTAPVVLLAVGLLALTLFVAARSTLWDRDEAIFGEAASEMADSGRWLYPTFNDTVLPDKPILAYWLMASSSRLGRSEVLLRIWSALAAAGAGLTAAAVASRFYSGGAAIGTVAILAASPLVMLEAGAATCDSLLLLFLTLAMLALSRLIDQPFRARSLMLLAAALALAFLTKGPVAIAIPLLAVFVLLALRPGIASPGRLAAAVTIVSAAATLAFLAWFLPANRASAGRFWAEGIGREVVGRALRAREGHGGIRILGLPYYAVTMAIGFSPWTMFLPGAVSAAAGGRLGGRMSRGFLFGWILSPLLLFSFVATRLPHYILPAFPALAIAVAATLDADRQGVLAARDGVWLRRGVWLFGPVAVLETVGLSAGAWFLPDPLRRPALLMAAIVAGFSGGAVAFQLRSRFRLAAGTLLVGAVAVQVAAAIFVLPALEREKPIPGVALDIRSRFRGDIPVATLGFSEPSLDYYLHRPPVERLRGARDLTRWCAQPGTGVLVATREALAAAPPPALRRLAEFASRRGFNYSKGRWIELVALERRALPR